MYLHYAFFGEELYNNLDKDFGFPCFRTAQRYKEVIIKENGLTNDMFDGSDESIDKLIKLCWDFEDHSDNRCVLATDAASVTASVVAHKNGLVTGLTRIQFKLITSENSLQVLITLSFR